MKSHNPMASFILLTLLSCITVLCCKACTTNEYEMNGECCQICPPGYRVLNHCNKTSDTTCTGCTRRTYTDVPNSLTACLNCDACHKGNGLRLKSKCSSSSNTICHPLTGYYCINTYNESCKKARKHSTCLPGEYIYQIGTALVNTVCMKCPWNTYSDSSFIQCKLYTNCKSLGQITVKEGTSSRDAVCIQQIDQNVISGVVLAIMLIVVLLSNILWKKRIR